MAASHTNITVIRTYRYSLAALWRGFGMYRVAVRHLAVIFTLGLFCAEAGAQPEDIDARLRCLLSRSDGVCLAYYLPYNPRYRTSAFINALEKRLPDGDLEDTNDFRDACLNTPEMGMEKLNEYADKYIDLHGAVTRRDTVVCLNKMLMVVLRLMKKAGLIYPDVQNLDLLTMKMAYILYTQINDLHMDKAPDISQFMGDDRYELDWSKADRALYAISHEAVTGAPGLLCIVGLVSKIRELIVLTALPSLENIDWILKHAPVLQEKLVAQVQSKHDRLLHLMQSRHIDLLCCDSEPDKDLAHDRYIAPYSIVRIIRDFHSKGVVYFFYYPLSNQIVKDTLKALLFANQAFDMVVVADFKAIPDAALETMEQHLPDLSYRRIPLPDSFRVFYTAHEKNSPTFYMIRFRAFPERDLERMGNVQVLFEMEDDS